jgi:ribulose-phosphate 3-epimerase
LEKARRLRDLLCRRELQIEVGMDGGLGHGNIGAALLAGVERMVVGSAVFTAPDAVAEMSALRRAALAKTAETA